MGYLVYPKAYSFHVATEAFRAIHAADLDMYLALVSLLDLEANICFLKKTRVLLSSALQFFDIGIRVFAAQQAIVVCLDGIRVRVATPFAQPRF